MSTPGWATVAHVDPDPPTSCRRVLVTGSRDWTDTGAVREALNLAWRDAGQPIVVVHGACPTGADHIADGWAVEHECAGITVERHRADWTLGPRGGPVRNLRMVNLGAWRVLAFPLGASPGSRGCVRLAQAAGLDVRVHEGATTP